MSPPPLRFALALLLSGCANHAASTSAGSTGGGSGPPPPPVSTSPGTSGAVPLVDVFIGTGNSAAPDAVINGQGGSTYPGAALPFGMVQWSPDTSMASPPGYFYGDNQIVGFSLTHLNGAGCMAKRDFPVYPVLSGWNASAEPVDSFAHSSEIASPGFYEVTLGSSIKVDLTATRRTGFARFTFPTTADAKVLISGGWQRDVVQARDFSATLRPDGTIVGSRTNTFFCGTAGTYGVHFAARFDRPFATSGTWSAGSMNPEATTVESGRVGAGAYAEFDAMSNPVVQMKMAISYVSEAGALANLEAESPGWDFDAVHAAAIARWNDVLGRVAVEGGTAVEQREFYSALYHAFLQPGTASDVGGQFVGFDGATKTASGYVRYADFSGWDIYRSWIQLASIVAPAETSDMMRSLVESGSECGALPQWALENTNPSVMVGDPADAILANAWAFGAHGFDAGTALSLMVTGATDPTAACDGMTARTGLADYMSLHYCPIDGDLQDRPNGPPSTTLEYAIADFSIAQLAAATGNSATQAEFLARGGYWKNVFDPTLQANGFTGYVEARYTADNAGAPAFDEGDVDKSLNFVEGSAVQYTFLVPHDVYGLITALGGDAMAVQRLDDHFTQVNAGTQSRYFYIGDEPGFDTPWQYPFAGAPWRTQDVVRRILSAAFADTPGGLPGNDDLGATSSWQVWAMLGLYPAIPGVGGFVIGSPVFTKATIKLAGEATLVITANGSSDAARYVQSAVVNGKPSTATWLPWGSVSAGGTVALTMGTTANQTWGAGASDRPPSFYP